MDLRRVRRALHLDLGGRDDEFGVMHVGGVDDSTFFMLRAVTPGVASGVDIMNKLPFRMILFVVVLSALHVATIAPRKVSAIQPPQETTIDVGLPTRLPDGWEAIADE